MYGASNMNPYGPNAHNAQIVNLNPNNQFGPSQNHFNPALNHGQNRPPVAQGGCCNIM